MGRGTPDPLKLNGSGGFDSVEASERLKTIGEQLRRAALSSFDLSTSAFAAFGTALRQSSKFEVTLADIARASGPISAAQAELAIKGLRSSGSASEAQLVALLRSAGSRESADDLLDAALPVHLVDDLELRRRLVERAFGPEAPPVDLLAWRDTLADEETRAHDLDRRARDSALALPGGSARGSVVCNASPEGLTHEQGQGARVTRDE